MFQNDSFRRTVRFAIHFSAVFIGVILFQNCGGEWDAIRLNMDNNSGNQSVADEDQATTEEEAMPEDPITGPTFCEGRRPGQNTNRLNFLYDTERIHDNFAKVNLDGFICPAPPPAPLVFDPPWFYLEDGVTPNPLFYTHMEPYDNYIRELNRLGDLFLASGSIEIARCVLDWVTAWSHTSLLTEMNTATNGKRQNYTTDQGDYERKWLIGKILFNYAKIFALKNLLDSTKINSLRDWLGRGILPIRQFHNEVILYNEETANADRPKFLNNHQYWAGLTVYLYGILFESTSDIQWGETRYRLGVDSILDNGSLATEMERGSQAFLYHQFALQPLVLIAEFNKLKGGDLYSYRANRLNLLADLVTRSFLNFDEFSKLTPTIQRHNPDIMINSLPYYLDWMEIWFSRHADPRQSSIIFAARNSTRSTNQRLRNIRTGGDMSLAWGTSLCRLNENN